MPTNATTTWSLAASDMLDKISTNRWIPWTLNAGAFALLVFGLAHGAWRLAAAPATPAARSPAIVRTDPSADLQLVLAAQIFGHARATSAESSPDRMPLSNLNLVLTGVLAKTTSSVALFSINGAPEAPIAVGEEVTAGAILDAVYPDRIVLRRAGAHEIVLLRDSSKLAPGSLSAPSTTASPGDIGALRSQMPGAGRAHEASVSGVQLPPPGPAQAADIGFEVQQIQPGSAYEQLGLRPGDVVRRVNGQLVNSSDALLRRFADTRGGGSMTVEVMRQGKTETLSYTSPDRR